VNNISYISDLFDLRDQHPTFINQQSRFGLNMERYAALSFLNY
jgi:hypothetical protein